MDIIFRSRQYTAAGSDCACLVLTGFRATGKSLLGRELARQLDFSFLDTDTLLCDRLGCSVAAWVAARGWQSFREQERILLAELAGSRRKVIATGGGAIMHRREWEKLRTGSTVIWLQADAVTIARRLQADRVSEEQRPALTGDDPCREIKPLLAERNPLYRQGSDLVVDTSSRSPKDLVVEILDRLPVAGKQENSRRKTAPAADCR